ncbi:MAG: hypothetical protein HOY78_18970 [Saccharothrix sp.]|nr:hypothetical protein [Saccharothrix sp.]
MITLTSGDGESNTHRMDKSSPTEVGVAFVKGYAVGDGAICDLAEQRFRDRLTRERRCDHPSDTAGPAASVFFERTCAHRTGMGIELPEQGRFDGRYVRVSLERDAEGRWLVVAVRAAQSRDEIPSYECAIPSGRFDG